jgi:hypothetical protein
LTGSCHLGWLHHSVYRLDGLLLHAGQHVGVGVEGDADLGVTDRLRELTKGANVTPT